MPKLAVSWTPNAEGRRVDLQAAPGRQVQQRQSVRGGRRGREHDASSNPKSGSGALAALPASSRRAAPRRSTRTTVQFNLDKPFADFPYLVCSSSYNTAILPRNYAGDFLKKPVGTGPWMLKSYVTNQACTMAKNPTYWGKDAQGRQLPYLDEVEFVFVDRHVGRQPAAPVGRRRRAAADRLPGRRRRCSATPTCRVDVYPSTGIRELAINTTKRRSGLARPPGGRLLPRPPGHQPGSVRRPQQPRVRHLLGAHGLPGQPAFDRARPGLSPRPSRCSPRPVIRTASTSR